MFMPLHYGNRPYSGLYFWGALESGPKKIHVTRCFEDIFTDPQLTI